MQGRFPRIGRLLRETSGALGDSGVLAPFALALIAVNGFHPSPLFLVFGVSYAAAALYYRLPVPVQPLKAMAVIALATGASVGMISVAALEMALILGLIAATGGAHLLERVFTRPLVRGVQLGVGLLLLRKALDMVLVGDGSGRLASTGGPLVLAIAAACTVLLLGIAAHERLSRIPAALLLLGLGAVFTVIAGGVATLPPLTAWVGPRIDWSLGGSALVLLVIPQLPLTLGNAAVAAAATAQDYYGERARRVTVRALCTSMGAFSMIAALTGGFPVCHGSGGFTAHYRFGARSGWSTFTLGVALIILALLAPGAVWAFLALVPTAVLSAMLAYVGVYHATLVRDVLGDARSAVPALLVGLAAVVTANLMIGIIIGGTAELILAAHRRTG